MDGGGRLGDGQRAVGGVLGGVPGMPVLEDAMSGMSQLRAKSGMSLGLAKSGINVLVQGLAGGASDVTTVLSNVAAHQPWYSGLLESTAIGLGEDGAIGSITGWHQQSRQDRRPAEDKDR